MDKDRFDAISKALSVRWSRRKTVTGGGIGLGAAVAAAASARPLGRRAAAQDATPAALPDGVGEDGSFLFVQTATSGTLMANPGAGTPAAAGGADYLLTLEGHPGGTVYFSDRPERVFGEAPTQQFLDGLGFSPANPPNAALVAQTDAGEDVVVLELLTPTYDDATGTVTYGANILTEYDGDGLAHVADQQLDAALPEQFTHASLFIDDCPNITDCDLILGGRVSDYIGPVPDGPYGRCWNWKKFTCLPCRDYGDLNALCNERFPKCQSACTAD